MPSESVQTKITQLREVMRDALAKPAPLSRESEAAQAFHRYQAHAGLPVLEQTPRARAEREIERIALTYGWQSAVTRALDAAGAATLQGLDGDQLEQLLERMRAHLDQAMTACDSDEAPPAR